MLNRLISGAEAGGRGGQVLAALVVRALVFDARQDRPAALADLAAALEIASPEGYVRTFIDAGPAMQALLSDLAPRSREAAQLLKAFDARDEDAGSGVASSGRPEVAALPEPLSDREQEVLALMAQGFTNQEIANRLVLSVNTVKTHAKNIYEKLGVRNRAEATLRATELHLL